MKHKTNTIQYEATGSRKRMSETDLPLEEKERGETTTQNQLARLVACTIQRCETVVHLLQRPYHLKPLLNNVGYIL